MSLQSNIPNNAEIDQALKEFELKKNEERGVQPTQVNPAVKVVISPKIPINETEGVTFDTDKEVESYTAIKLYKETVAPKMVKAVMKISGGKIKEQRQAEYVLFSIVCLIVLISIILVYRSVVVLPAKPVALPPDYYLYHNQTK